VRQTLRAAGFAPRTLLMFTWKGPGQGKALKDDVLRDAVDISGVAMNLLGEESQGKGKAKEKDDGSSSGAKKLPKWLGKLSKK
jgi:hypothetical protein